MIFGFGKNKKRSHFDFGLLGADMHSHLVPGIDDGVPDLQTSLEFIKELKELGYKKIITTPHIMWDMYQNTHEIILDGLGALRKAISGAGIDIQVDAAAEYFIDDHLELLLKSGEKLLTFGNNMVLVEFSMASAPFDMNEVLFQLQLQGYQPVIAHPERYIYAEKGKHFFDELKDSGYLFQLNILSLSGIYGKEVQKLSRYLIDKEYYDLIGTDLHNRRHLDALYDKTLKPDLYRLLDSGKIRNTEL